MASTTVSITEIMESKDEKKSTKKISYLIAAICLAAVGMFFVGILVYNRIETKRQQELLERLQQEAVTSVSVSVEEEPIVSIEEPEASIEPEEPKVDLSIYDFPDKEIDFETLKAVNEDIYSWIYIPDTGIDYPVLQSIDSDEYYLRRDYEGKKNNHGCIFTQFYNSLDYSDFNTVMYGHNFVDGLFFSNLHYYEDYEFFDSHPYIYVFTPEGNLVYQVFAAYTFSNIHLMLGFDTLSDEGKAVYIDNIFNATGLNNNYNEELGVTPEDHILTLSTCMNNNDSTKRYLVACKLVADARENGQ